MWRVYVVLVAGALVCALVFGTAAYLEQSAKRNVRAAAAAVPLPLPKPASLVRRVAPEEEEVVTMPGGEAPRKTGTRTRTRPGTW
jgi:hypothetical protein